MADRPILFSGPMVRAIIDGRKTQTRRTLSGAVSSHPPYVANYKEGSCAVYEDADGCVWRFVGAAGASIGDRLWVREAWGCLEADHTSACKQDGYRKPQPGDAILYQADPESAAQWGRGLPSQGGFMWRPSIHMPRWASRLTLIVESVKVERLQDISEEDAIAEGIHVGTRSFEHSGENGVFCRETPWFSVPGIADTGCGTSAVDMFSTLWESINGADSWKANPWVVAIAFRVGCGNIDSDKWAAAGASEARP
jgi:hypothetical protein